MRELLLTFFALSFACIAQSTEPNSDTFTIEDLLPEEQHAFATIEHWHSLRHGDWWMVLRKDIKCDPSTRPLKCEGDVKAYRLRWSYRAITDRQELYSLAANNRAHWEMASLKTCEGAMATLHTVSDRDCIQTSFDTDDVESFRIIPMIDGASAKVRYLGSRYIGHAHLNSPGEWATELNASLNGCWEAADLPAPWDN